MNEDEIKERKFIKDKIEAVLTARDDYVLYTDPKDPEAMYKNFTKECNELLDMVCLKNPRIMKKS